MNRELAQQLFDSLKNGATAVSDTVTSELPLVAAQLINWLIAENAIWTILGLVAFIVSARYFFDYLKNERTGEREDCSATISFFVGLIAIPVFITNLFELVKVLVAPKIVLLEYLASFLGAGGCQ